jgi:glutamine amidotransferase
MKSAARVGVVDYQAGNIRSVETALRRLRADFFVSDDPGELLDAGRLVFPGVGEASAAMSVLADSGLGEAVSSFFRSGRPLLGICIGSQIIMDSSEERSTRCLGLLAGRTVRFPEDLGLKVPHMGWNQVRYVKPHALFKGIADGTSFYFVHSYYPDPSNTESVLARTDYGITFASAVGWENLLAVQFHPEKSGEPGLRLLANFLGWGA